MDAAGLATEIRAYRGQVTGNNRAMQITVNGTLRTLDAPAHDIAALVRALGLEGKRIAVERNGEIVPKSRYAVTPLEPGDSLEIVGAVGGG